MNDIRTILHVDDDPEVLQVVSRRLSAAGHEVRSLQDPRETPRQLLESGARLVLLDIDMPHIDGIRLLRQIKRDDGGIQVIMLTGMVSTSTVLRSMRYGAEACLFKPVTNFDPLLEAVESAFEKVERWWQSLDELRQRKERCRQHDRGAVSQ